MFAMGTLYSHGIPQRICKNTESEFLVFGMLPKTVIKTCLIFRSEGNVEVAPELEDPKRDENLPDQVVEQDKESTPSTSQSSGAASTPQ